MDIEVSVIITAYNIQAYLPQCLDSVLAERARSIEVIVVNDGSTDCTTTICRAYSQADKRLRTITRPNTGPGGARNAGLDLATGRYVMFVDGDDMLIPGAISQLAEIMDTGVDIACGRSYKGRSGSEQRLPDHHHPGTPQLISNDRALTMMLYQDGVFTASVWGRMFRRSYIGDLRFKESIYYEDLEFNYRMLRKPGRIALTRRHVYFYRINPGSITHVWSTRRLDVLAVTEEMERDALASGDSRLLDAARERRMSASFNMFLLCSIHGHATMASRCWDTIMRLRRQGLANRKARLKSRVGAALSYLGPGTTALIGRLLYRPE